MGCSEGGCGACAVQVWYTDEQGKWDTSVCTPPRWSHPNIAGTTRLKSVNSCLTPVGSVLGKHAIVTACGLGNHKDGYDIVQGNRHTHPLVLNYTPQPPRTHCRLFRHAVWVLHARRGCCLPHRNPSGACCWQGPFCLLAAHPRAQRQPVSMHWVPANRGRLQGVCVKTALRLAIA